MFADLRVARLNGMFRHALEVGIRWTANSLRIGEGFREIRPGEAEKLGIVKIVKRAMTFSWHRFAWPGSSLYSDRFGSRIAMTSFALFSQVPL